MVHSQFAIILELFLNLVHDIVLFSSFLRHQSNTKRIKCKSNIWIVLMEFTIQERAASSPARRASITYLMVVHI